MSIDLEKTNRASPEINETPVTATEAVEQDSYSIERLQKRLDIYHSDEKIVLAELDADEVERIRSIFKDWDAKAVQRERSRTRREVLINISTVLMLGASGGFLYYAHHLSNKGEEIRKKRLAEFQAQEKKNEEVKKMEDAEREDRINKLPKMKLVPGALNPKPILPEGINDMIFNLITAKLASMVKELVGEFEARNYKETDSRVYFKFNKKLYDNFLRILNETDKKFIKFIENLQKLHWEHDGFWLTYLNEYLKFQGLHVVSSLAPVNDKQNKHGITIYREVKSFHAYADGKSCSDIFYLKTLINAGYHETSVQGAHRPSEFNGIIVFVDHIEKYSKKRAKTEKSKSVSDLYPALLSKTTYHEFVHAYIDQKYPLLTAYKKLEESVCNRNLSGSSMEFMEKTHKFCLPSDKKFRGIQFSITSWHEICTHGAELVFSNDVNELLELISWVKGDSPQYAYAFDSVRRILDEDARKHGGLKKGFYLTKEGLFDYVISQSVWDDTFLRRIGIALYEYGIKIIDSNQGLLKEAIERMGKYRKENALDKK